MSVLCIIFALCSCLGVVSCCMSLIIVSSLFFSVSLLSSLNLFCTAALDGGKIGRDFNRFSAPSISGIGEKVTKILGLSSCSIFNRALSFPLATIEMMSANLFKRGADGGLLLRRFFFHIFHFLFHRTHHLVCRLTSHAFTCVGWFLWLVVFSVC